MWYVGIGDGVLRVSELSYLCFTGLLCALCQLGEVGGGGPVVLEVAAHQVTSCQGGHQAQLPGQHRGAHQSEDEDSDDDEEAVLESSPCGRWHKRKEQV